MTQSGPTTINAEPAEHAENKLSAVVAGSAFNVVTPS
jgi:hypothetical protein